MGKGTASGYIPVEITICGNCFHKDVCGDKDYLTENKCCDFADADELAALKQESEKNIDKIPIVEPLYRNKDGVPVFPAEELTAPYQIEATESEAKHIIELLQAESEGRLVILPGNFSDEDQVEYFGIVDGQVKAIGRTDCVWAKPFLERLRDKKAFLTPEAALAAMEGTKEK